jgi:hypothetical protein
MGQPPAGETFVSEAVVPQVGSFDAAAMSRGEPGLPRVFTWRGRRFEVVRVLSTWKTSTRERGELYLRRHWFEALVATGERVTLYCERQTKNRKAPKARWWLYKINA